jgi:hypothetical protein
VNSLKYLYSSQGAVEVEDEAAILTRKV